MIIYYLLFKYRGIIRFCIYLRTSRNQRTRDDYYNTVRLLLLWNSCLNKVCAHV